MSTPAPRKVSSKSANAKPAAASGKVKAIPFPEKAGKDVFNASELVPISDGRFIFCDNNLNTELLELRIDSDGQMVGGLRRLKIGKLPDGAVDDMEGMTAVEQDGRTTIYVSTSMSLKKGNVEAKKRSQRGEEFSPRNALLRISVGKGERLSAEIVPDFKHWLIDRSPDIRKAARWLPDEDGLNVEGIGWDPKLGALLFGVRSPVVKGKPIILRVRIKSLNGPWDVSNFESLAPIHLEIERGGDEQGIRSIEFDPSRNAHLVIVGNSTSRSRAPFEMYLWDGNEAGRVTKFRQLEFSKSMRPEGVTHGTIGGKGCVVFVDDLGGYQVIFDDDPRLSVESRKKPKKKGSKKAKS